MTANTPLEVCEAWVYTLHFFVQKTLHGLVACSSNRMKTRRFIILKTWHGMCFIKLSEMDFISHSVLPVLRPSRCAYAGWPNNKCL